MDHGVTILDACRDPKLFGPWFRTPETWLSWFAFLSALFGLAMLPEMVAIFEACTARTVATLGTITEVWLICGRRSGKSFVLALIAVYVATFINWRHKLTPGEAGVVVPIVYGIRT